MPDPKQRTKKKKANDWKKQEEGSVKVGRSKGVAKSEDRAKRDGKKTPKMKQPARGFCTVFKELSQSWPEEMQDLFSPKTSDARRAELLDIVGEQGADLQDKYAWAIPDARAIRIIAHFSPLVEIGAGKGYWAYLLKKAGADILAYDALPDAREQAATAGRADKKTRWTDVSQGGPEVLQLPSSLGRTLMLCYPDEYELSDESLGLSCLQKFSGDTVIHIGELFGDTISLEQAPWGRTSGADFQSCLAANFHCILRIQIPRWPISRDTLSIWKRTSTVMVTADDSEDDDLAGGSSNGDTWGHIPRSEQLPADVAAPCVAHLLHK